MTAPKPPTPTVTLSQAKELVRCLADSESLLLLAPPGVGKSEVVRQAAAEAGLEVRSLLGTRQLLGINPVPGIEDRVVSLLEIYDVVDRALVLSFDHAALAAVARSNPGLARAALLEPRTRLPENITAVTPSGATAVGLPARLVTEQRVRAARAADLDLYIWTVNDPARMDSLIEWGVRGIITDRPDVLRSRPRFA